MSSCYASLVAARTAIAAACTLSADVIVVEKVAYPATFIVDNYLSTYQMSCRTDRTTGEYCDLLIASWSNHTRTSSDPGFVYTPTHLPTAPDTLTDCESSVNYDNSTDNLNSCMYTHTMSQQTASWHGTLVSTLTWPHVPCSRVIATVPS